MKTIRSIPLMAAIALTLAAAPLIAADRMQAGMWELTSTANGETHTFKHCVTPDETGNVNGDTKTARANAEKRAAAGHCTISDYNINGNVMTYAMVCGKTSLRSTGTYQGTSFEADVKTRIEGAPEVATHVSAKRLGVCPPKPAK
jgi:hypothetical protein